MKTGLFSEIKSVFQLIINELVSGKLDLGMRCRLDY